MPFWADIFYNSLHIGHGCGPQESSGVVRSWKWIVGRESVNFFFLFPIENLSRSPNNWKPILNQLYQSYSSLIDCKPIFSTRKLCSTNDKPHTIETVHILRKYNFWPQRWVLPHTDYVLTDSNPKAVYQESEWSEMSSISLSRVPKPS